jgi:hypothetical protein
MVIFQATCWKYEITHNWLHYEIQQSLLAPNQGLSCLCWICYAKNKYGETQFTPQANGYNVQWNVAKSIV